MGQATCCTQTVLQCCHAVPVRHVTLACCAQSITALAHLRAAVLYVMDISEQCGYTIAQQAALFHSIKPLFSNKPLMIVANKTDAAPLSSLSEADNATLRDMVSAAATASNGGETLLLQCACLHHSLHGCITHCMVASLVAWLHHSLHGCITRCMVASLVAWILELAVTNVWHIY